jgi:lipopolysaccharide/colanic/teichoic acid biosynthesis glycosyltransferase
MPTVRPPAFEPAVRPTPVPPTPPATERWDEVDWLPGDARLRLDPPTGWYGAMKPALEIGAAVLLLPLTLMVIGLAWALVRATSRGPGFYVQTRLGRNGRRYRIVKLRTMYDTAAVARNIEWAKRNDRRITPVGKVLRLLHIDELPQLFNVLRGEMSLVGPRPERPEVIESKGLRQQVPGYDLRTAVRPGVTGLAQVQLPADTNALSVRHKVYYDLYYLMNRSLWLDLRLCAATALKAFLGPNTLRKVLFLPTREKVVAQVLAMVHGTPDPGTDTPPPKPAATLA